MITSTSSIANADGYWTWKYLWSSYNSFPGDMAPPAAGARLVQGDPGRKDTRWGRASARSWCTHCQNPPGSFPSSPLAHSWAANTEMGPYIQKYLLFIGIICKEPPKSQCFIVDFLETNTDCHSMTLTYFSCFAEVWDCFMSPQSFPSCCSIRNHCW